MKGLLLSDNFLSFKRCENQLGVKKKKGCWSTSVGNTNMPSYWVRKHLSLLHQWVMCWQRYLAPQLRAGKSCHNVLWVSLGSRCLSLKPQVFMVAVQPWSEADLNKRWERKIYQNSNVKRRKCVSLGWPPGWPSTLSLRKNTDTLQRKLISVVVCTILFFLSWPRDLTTDYGVEQLRLAQHLHHYRCSTNLPTDLLLHFVT